MSLVLEECNRKFRRVKIAIFNFRSNNNEFSALVYRNFIEKGILYIRHASDRMESMRIKMRRKRVAIVTGASSGFGREFVKLFEHKKEIEEIWAVARDKKKLRQLSEEYGKKVRCISMDLSSKRCIKKFGDFLKKEKVSISYLVNSAGYGKFGSYGDLDIDSSLNMIDLNVSGVVAMGLVCIPHIRQGGHIINVASQASFQPLPYFNIYSATKAFVRNYSRALNIELRDRGISVTAVCPGWMKTAFLIGLRLARQRSQLFYRNGITRKGSCKGIERCGKRQGHLCLWWICEIGTSISKTFSTKNCYESVAVVTAG